MELDIKQQVLAAIYMEYQKDLPKMEDITHTKLNIDKDKFNVALIKLKNEGLISNVLIMSADNSIYEVYMGNTMMTREGIQYVEEILEIQKTSTNKEKIKTAISKLGGWGFNLLSEFGTKIAVEMGVKMITG